MKKLLIGLLALGTVSAFADTTNYLKIKTYTDLVAKNCQTLESPKTFHVDASFIKNTSCLQFYVFLDSQDVKSICFVGKPSRAIDAIDAILSATTGDAWIYPSDTAKVTKKLVSRKFKYVGEGGASWEVASVPACKH